MGEDELLATPFQETGGRSVRDGVNVMYVHHSGAKGMVSMPGKQTNFKLCDVSVCSVCLCSL